MKNFLIAREKVDNDVIGLEICLIGHGLPLVMYVFSIDIHILK